MTYGGGPEGGYVKKNGKWYEWERVWGAPATYEAIEDGLAPLIKVEDGCELITLACVLHRLLDDEFWFDDCLEDNPDEESDPESGNEESSGEESGGEESD